MRRSILAVVWLSLILFPTPPLLAGPLPGHHWQVLTVVYPPGQTVFVNLGGAEKTLTAKGICRVKYRKEAALLDIEIKNLPSAVESGWTGRQYVLWAVDREMRTLNMGLVPSRGKDAKWSVQVPFRIFGLLVTAETNPTATIPSAAVAMESLLPTDPGLVLPVYKIDIALAPPPG